nr:FAD-binding protein [Angustibacter aerolatus]
MREVDDADEPLLLVAGGSNLLVGDDPVPGTVVRVATSGIEVESDDRCGGANVRVAAGESWDGLVERAVAEGWAGIESLSGIPGSTGATPVQNVGAYGQEVSTTVAQVRVWDRMMQQVRTFANADCRFGYRTRTSRAPAGTSCSTSCSSLRVATLAEPVRYADLAKGLGVEPGRPGAAGRCARGRARAAPPPRHGARRRRPRHVERRLVLHQPRARRRRLRGAHASGRRAARRRRRRALVPRDARPREDQRRLAHRARRLRPRPRPARPGVAVDQAHPRAHQPRLGPRGRRRRAGPRGPRRRARRLRRHPRARARARRRHPLGSPSPTPPRPAPLRRRPRAT